MKKQGVPENYIKVLEKIPLRKFINQTSLTVEKITLFHNFRKDIKRRDISSAIQ